MGTPHYFTTDNITAFRKHLEVHNYTSDEANGWRVCSKELSGAVVKHYSFWGKSSDRRATHIRVTYELLQDGKPLLRLANKLKKLNWRYLRSLPGWKTKGPSSFNTRDMRLSVVHAFMADHQELINCFRYQPDKQLTEGNQSFNVEMASTPKELSICFQFIKGLLAAYAPHGIVRGRREIDKPSLQRNGWIKRYAGSCKKRGLGTLEIAREIQKELREGTWNERSKLQYNLAGGTICKIAGMKISHRNMN